MSQNSDMAFMIALTTGLVKSWDKKFLKYLECFGPSTWKEVQAGLERICRKRITDSNISSAAARLNKENKIKIIGDRTNEQSGFPNSVYDLVR